MFGHKQSVTPLRSRPSGGKLLPMNSSSSRGGSKPPISPDRRNT